MTQDPFEFSAAEADKGDRRLAELFCEYVGRIEAGERIDRDEITSRHPDLARELLEQLETFEELGGDVPSAPPCGKLGDYTLRRRLGRGGMGVVYEAWQGSLDRQVALKVLPVGVAADRKACVRFMREAQTAGHLSHPNVVSVYSTGVEEGTPWYSMEYVKGETLGQVLTRLKEAEEGAETVFGNRDRAGYFEKLVEAFADVADGLQHAHSKGVTHRDIKPSNLILDHEGRLRILDFGLARLEGQESLTLSGDFVGTPAYMSPEQAKRRKIPVDHRTDIYSLGATLYELVTHEQPFHGKDHQDTLSQIIERDPRPPRQLNPRVPAALETIVLKCLRKDAGDRYGTAEALGQDLRRFVRGDPIEARPESPFEKLGRRFIRYRAAVVGTIIALLLVVTGLAVANVIIAREREQARYDLYLANMRLAADDWRSGNLHRFERTLREHVPEPGETDLRGWEWYFLRSIRRAELLTLEGHATSVHAVAWSPDGETVASGGDDGRVILWSSETGDPLGSLPAHDGKVNTLAFSPDGESFASAGSDGQVKFFSIASLAELPGLPRAEQGVVTALAWSPDGRWLAVAGRFRTVEVWRLDTAERVAQFDPGWPRKARRLRVALDWSADSERLVALSKSHFVVWQAGRWEEICRSRKKLWNKTSISFSPDGRSLVQSDAGPRIRIFDARTADERGWLPGHDGYTFSVAWSPRADRIASAGTDNLLKVHDVEGNADLLILRGHEEWVWSLAWSPDGARLASASIDGTVRVWKPERASAATPGSEHPAAFSPDGEWRASRSESEQAVLVFEVDTGDLVQRLPGDVRHLKTLAFSPDGRLLAQGGLGIGLKVWEWQTSRLVDFTTDPFVHDVAWSPDGALLAYVSDHEVVFRDVATARETRRLPAQKAQLRSIEWSPDGELFATSSRGGRVKVWDTRTWTEILVFDRRDRAQMDQGGRHNGLAFSADGLHLIAPTERGEIIIWDVVTGDELVRVRGHTAHAKCVALSPDGTRLATAGGDGKLKIWDASRIGELREVIRVEDEALEHIWSLAWHPDGRRLLSAEPRPGSLRIWDARTAYEAEDP